MHMPLTISTLLTTHGPSHRRVSVAPWAEVPLLPPLTPRPEPLSTALLAHVRTVRAQRDRTIRLRRLTVGR